MFTGIEILYIIVCLVFIALVLFQSNSSSGISNLTNGNSGSSKSKRITMVTKIMAGIGLLVFSLTFYIAYDHKKENSNTTFEVSMIEHKDINNDK